MQDKHATIRQHFQTEAAKKDAALQAEKQIAQLKSNEAAIYKAFTALISYLKNSTSKVELINQLKSISTPDVDKVVLSVEKLRKAVDNKNIDLSKVEKVLVDMNEQLKLIPKSHPDAPEPVEEVRVTNLSDMDWTPLVSAIKQITLKPENKVDVKAPIVNVAPTDLKPLQALMLDLIKAVGKIPQPKFPKIPEYPKFTKIEDELKKQTKKLDEILKKPVGGGGGGGGGSTFVDPTGMSKYPILNSNGRIPIELGLLAGSSYTETKDSTYYGDGVISGIPPAALRHFDGQGYNRTAAVKLEWDDTTTANVVYVGKAKIGTAKSDPLWQIQRVNTSTKEITYAASGAFTATWDNRATSETYS